AGIDLDVAARVVVDRHAGLLVDALRPVDGFHIGLGEQRLPIGAVERVEKPVAAGVGDELARLPGNLSVDQDVGAGRIVVPHVARRVLVVPVHLAGVGGPRDQAVGVEVITRAIIGIEHRDRIAGAPQHLIGSGVVGTGDPHGAAAGLPGVVLVLPGLAARLAGSRDDVLAPHHLAGRAVKRGDEIAHAAVAAGGADDDLVLHGEGRCGELQIGLAVGEIGLPRDLAGLLVGGDRTGRIVRNRDDEVAP